MRNTPQKRNKNIGAIYNCLVRLFIEKPNGKKTEFKEVEKTCLCVLFKRQNVFAQALKNRFHKEIFTPKEKGRIVKLDIVEKLRPLGYTTYDVTKDVRYSFKYAK